MKNIIISVQRKKYYFKYYNMSLVNSRADINFANDLHKTTPLMMEKRPEIKSLLMNNF